jgi:hypothetical protein
MQQQIKGRSLERPFVFVQCPGMRLASHYLKSWQSGMSLEASDRLGGNMLDFHLDQFGFWTTRAQLPSWVGFQTRNGPTIVLIDCDKGAQSATRLLPSREAMGTQQSL